jgi:hypothetical protein
MIYQKVLKLVKVGKMTANKCANVKIFSYLKLTAKRKEER